MLNNINRIVRDLWDNRTSQSNEFHGEVFPKGLCRDDVSGVWRDNDGELLPCPSRHRKPDAERFTQNLRVLGMDKCWPWAGTRNQQGYGVFEWRNNNKRFTGAHRFSYELFVGPIPGGLLVCHHCDNPPCVNPAHLFLGTHKDNAEDALKKGRWLQIVSHSTCRNCGVGIPILSGTSKRVFCSDKCRAKSWQKLHRRYRLRRAGSFGPRPTLKLEAPCSTLTTAGMISKP